MAQGESRFGETRNTRRFLVRQRFAAALALSALAVSGFGQLTIPSDGSDGALTPASSKVIDLGKAISAGWQTPGVGNGVYDKTVWAVVFKFTQVNIPAGVTVTFTNHPKNAPVVFLVQGNCTIAGSLVLDGKNGNNQGAIVMGGPGGFASGAARIASQTGSAGQGPGGGDDPATGSGSFGTNGFGVNGGVYGVDDAFPLIGGSGGTWAEAGNHGGGAGGGAILLAASGTIIINNTGMISANGGFGVDINNSLRAENSGSGGAVRLAGNTVQVDGKVFATSGPNNGSGQGGFGRIRIETNSLGASGTIVPAPNVQIGVPNNTPPIFPDATAPSIVIKTVGGIAVGDDPSGWMLTPDVVLNSSGGVDAVIETRNVPTSWTLIARLVPRNGDVSYITAQLVSGNSALATWKATLSLPNGPAALIVKATAPGNQPKK